MTVLDAAPETDIAAPGPPVFESPSLHRRLFGLSGSTIRYLAMIFVTSRLLNIVFVLRGRRGILPFGLLDAGPGTGGTLLSPWTFFDGRWYLKISGTGYEDFTSVFYPLYPNLLKLAGSEPVHRAMFGIALSTLCFGLALPLLFRLVETSYGTRVARTTCAITAFLPFSAVWGAVYTESLALLLLVLTWTFVRQGRWLAAALPALLVGLTRNIGFVLSAAMFVEFLQQSGQQSAQRSLRRGAPVPQAGHRRSSNSSVTGWALFACALSTLASGGFTVWARQRFGVTGGLSAQQAYARGLEWPWWAVWRDLSTMTSYLTVGKMLSLGAILVAFSVAILQRRRLRLGEHVLVRGVLAMHLLMARQNPPHTIGAARYLMTCFPFAIGIALCVERFPKRWVAPLTILMIAMCALGATTFGAGQFEIG